MIVIVEPVFKWLFAVTANIPVSKFFVFGENSTLLTTFTISNFFNRNTFEVLHLIPPFKLNDNLVATVTAIYRRMFIEGGRIYPTAPLKQLCSKIGSGATPKGGKTAYQESGVSLVRSTNVFDYAFSYDDLAHISDEQADQLSNVIVEENDVLFNITGVSVTRCCIVPADVLPARVNQHVMILRPKTAMPMSYYIMTTLCSAENKGKLMGIAQSGSTREAINKQEMESFSIPVPPTKEVQDFEIKARGLYESVIRNTEEIMRLNVMQQLLLSQLSSR